MEIKKKYQIFMHEMEWIVWVFIEFFIFYFVKLVVGWSNICCKLILVIESKFGSNLTIRSSYSRWKHFLAVGSSQIWFSTIRSQIWQLDALTKHEWNISRWIFKNSNLVVGCRGRDAKKSSMASPLLNVHITSHSIFSPMYLPIANISLIFLIFLLTDYRCSVFFFTIVDNRYSSIFRWKKKLIFQTLHIGDSSHGLVRCHLKENG